LVLYRSKGRLRVRPNYARGWVWLGKRARDEENTYHLAIDIAGVEGTQGMAPGAFEHGDATGLRGAAGATGKNDAVGFVGGNEVFGEDAGQRVGAREDGSVWQFDGIEVRIVGFQCTREAFSGRDVGWR